MPEITTDIKVNGLTFERATRDDLAELLVLQKLACRSEAERYGDFTLPPLLQTMDEIREEFGGKVFLKAVKEGMIAGSVRANSGGGTCYIGRLIVQPELQNQGIGTALLTRTEALFAAAERYELFTGHKSEKSLHIYRKLGYRPFKTELVHENLNLVYLEKRNQPRKNRGQVQDFAFRNGIS